MGQQQIVLGVLNLPVRMLWQQGANFCHITQGNDSVGAARHHKNLMRASLQALVVFPLRAQRSVGKHGGQGVGVSWRTRFADETAGQILGPNGLVPACAASLQYWKADMAHHQAANARQREDLAPQGVRHEVQERRDHHQSFDALGSMAGHRSRERRAKRMTEQGQRTVGVNAVQDLQRLFKKEAEVISDCRAV
jgi:hypothetical protein